MYGIKKPILNIFFRFKKVVLVAWWSLNTHRWKSIKVCEFFKKDGGLVTVGDKG